MESNLALAIDRMKTFWVEQGIQPQEGCSPELIEKVQTERGFTLPPDFCQLFLSVNGMKGLFPNYFDKEGFLFYPLQGLVIRSEAMKSDPAGYIADPEGTRDNDVIFADFMNESWWYAFSCEPGPNEYTIGLVIGAKEYLPLTRSLQHFIDLYLEDSILLYPP